jgi:hypothetical protein
MKSEASHVEVDFPSGVVDVAQESRIGKGLPLLTVVVVIPLVLGIAAICSILGLSAVVVFLMIAAVLVVVFLLYFSRARRIAHRHATLLVEFAKESMTPSNVRAFLSATALWNPSDALKEATRRLAAGGHHGYTIRIGPHASLEPVRPLAVQFEPMSLDETDIAFQQVSASADEPCVAAVVDTNEDRQMLRRVQRNVRLKGGWWIAVIFGLIVAGKSFGAYRAGRVTADLIMMFGLFLAVLFVPMNFGGVASEFWAVPGGLLVRRSRWRRGLCLILFTRDCSTVCCYREYGNRWRLIASDGENIETTIGTSTEMTFALRAWYSPLPPHTIEQLSDWE